MTAFESDLTRDLRDPKFRRAYNRMRTSITLTAPLCIDGREYARRRKARRRRGR